MDMIFFTGGGLSGETGIVERSIISYLWRIETCTILVKQFITYQWRVFYELCHVLNLVCK